MKFLWNYADEIEAARILRDRVKKLEDIFGEGSGHLLRELAELCEEKADLIMQLESSSLFLEMKTK